MSKYTVIPVHPAWLEVQNKEAIGVLQINYLTLETNNKLGGEST